MDASRAFDTVVSSDRRGRAHIAVPFDPNTEWGPKPKHHVRGEIDGATFRGVVTDVDGGHEIVLGPAWVRECGVPAGTRVRVTIEPEGPQRSDLAPDVQAALDDEPDAAAFFDSLAQFYRKAYLRWIDSMKRSPELRAARIAEMVELLKAGKKERPAR